MKKTLALILFFSQIALAAPQSVIQPGEKIFLIGSEEAAYERITPEELDLLISTRHQQLCTARGGGVPVQGPNGLIAREYTIEHFRAEFPDYPQNQVPALKGKVPNEQGLVDVNAQFFSKYVFWNRPPISRLRAAVLGSIHFGYQQALSFLQMFTLVTFTARITHSEGSNNAAAAGGFSLFYSEFDRQIEFCYRECLKYDRWQDPAEELSKREALELYQVHSEIHAYPRMGNRNLPPVPHLLAQEAWCDPS